MLLDLSSEELVGTAFGGPEAGANKPVPTNKLQNHCQFMKFILRLKHKIINFSNILEEFWQWIIPYSIK